MIGFARDRAAPLSPILVEGPVMLRAAEGRDASPWIALRTASRTHVTRWEPDWSDADMTTEAFHRRLQAQARERRAAASMPLLVFRRSDGALVGGVNLLGIRYRASRSAALGYWIGAAFTRRGYAEAAVRAVCAYPFERLDLNRVEAATRPENEPSRRLLEKVGFRVEGLARDYLHINGAWRDHCIYALLAKEWPAQVVARENSRGIATNRSRSTEI